MLDVTSHLIDRRIGVLVREGVQLFYAFKDADYFEGATANGVKAWLDGLPAEPAEAAVEASAKTRGSVKPKHVIRRFVVEVTPKMKVYAGGWQNGVHTAEVYAASGREAVAKARRDYRENNDVPAGFRIVERD